MIARVLQLRPSLAKPRAAVAWCLSGTGPEEWLAELGRWELPDDSGLRLFILPQSMRSRDAGGLFVILPPGQTPRRIPAGLGFARVGKKLYLPVDATLRPEMSEAELHAVVTSEAALVLHPALGAVGFDAADELHLADLIIPPPRRLESWTAPLPGTSDLPRLTAVSVRPPTLDELFGSSAADIGSEPPPELLEPPPGEDVVPPKNPAGSGGGLGGAIGRGLLPLIRMAKNWGKGGAASGGKPNLWEKSEQWLTQKLNKMREDLREARQKAIEKLLDDLKRNPDEGLRHALPLARSGLHRGRALPSANLGAHGTDFNLGKIRRSGPVDGWDLPPDFQRELRRHYLELAQREIQMGRHRRAAYIYAELLGDLGMAAQVLKNGGHPAEAAVLYRDHLQRPLEAAECFVAAGQIAEAVKIYEAGAHWEKLGKLYRQLGEEEKAGDAFRRWVKELIGNDDRVRAADILLEELQSRDEALSLLEGAWPVSRQSRACVERALTLRAREGEHDQSAKLLQKLVETPGPRTSDAISLFGALQSSYPDRNIKQLAEDLGRREIARLLPSALEVERSELARLLTHLAPEDRILQRDSLRYLDRQRRKDRGATRRVSPDLPLLAPGQIEVHQISQCDLPWQRAVFPPLTARAAGDAFCVLAYHQAKPELCLIYGAQPRLRDAITLSWRIPEELWISRLMPLLALPPGQLNHALVTYPEFPDVLLHRFRESDRPSSLEIGAPGWLTDPHCGAAFAASGDLFVVSLTQVGLRIAQFSQYGTLKGDRLAPRLEEALVETMRETQLPLPMQVMHQQIVIAVHHRLLTISLKDPLDIEPQAQENLFSEPIRALAPSPTWGSPRIAVVTQSKVYVHWLGGKNETMLVCDQLPEPPQAIFTTDGALVVVSGRSGMVIQANSNGKVQRWRFELPAPAAALVASPNLWMFSVIDHHSRLTEWRYDNHRLGSGATQ